MTTTEKTKEIRARFKAAGFSSRKISVRVEYFGCSSSIRVKIKDASVPFHMVKNIVEEYANIHRCPVSGEILGGGNTFTDIQHTTEAQAELAARYVDAVSAAVAKIDGRFLETVHGEARVGAAEHDDAFYLWIGDRMVQQCTRRDYGYTGAALLIALADTDQQDNR